MVDEWTSPATIVSAWGAIAATAASLIAWRVFRWQRQAEIPIVNCEPAGKFEEPGWVALHIIIRNGTDTRWQSHQMQITSPRGMRGLSSWVVQRIYEPGGSTRLDVDRIENEAARVFEMRAKTDPVGTPRPQHFSGGDTTREMIYLLPSGSKSRHVKMKLTLVSMDAVERRVNILIKRTLPAEI